MKNYSKEMLVEKVNKELKVFFDKKIANTKSDNAFFTSITKDLKEYTLRGGKRIRPIFFIYGYKAITGKITDEIIKLSIFLELIQSSLLIHDDIIDQDKLRRGGMTIHEKYSCYFSEKDNDFGSAIAIVIGDIAMNFAYEIIASSKFDDNIKIELVKMVSNFVTKVDYGQSVDIKLSKIDKFDVNDVKNVHYFKTMFYTTMMPLQAGAILGGANRSQLSSIVKYAENVGLAFQIQDDIMGIFGDEKKVGKPIGSDIKENKKTLLIYYALKNIKDTDRKYLLGKLGSSNISAEDMIKIKKIIKDSGSFDKSREMAQKLVSNGIKNIQIADIDKVVKKELINISKYIITRSK